MKMDKKTLEEMLTSKDRMERLRGRIHAALRDPLYDYIRAESERYTLPEISAAVCEFYAMELAYMAHRFSFNGREGEALQQFLTGITQVSYEALQHYIENEEKSDVEGINAILDS